MEPDTSDIDGYLRSRLDEILEEKQREGDGEALEAGRTSPRSMEGHA